MRINRAANGRRYARTSSSNLHHRVDGTSNQSRDETAAAFFLRRHSRPADRSFRRIPVLPTVRRHRAVAVTLDPARRHEGISITRALKVISTPRLRRSMPRSPRTTLSNRTAVTYSSTYARAAAKPARRETTRTPQRREKSRPSFPVQVPSTPNVRTRCLTTWSYAISKGRR